MAVVAQPFNYQITAANGPASFGATLPAGLNVAPGTGLVTGTLSTPGNYSMTVTASNPTGMGSAAVQLEVMAPIAYWRACCFGGNAPGVQIADTAVNNWAGIPNLMVYALGLDPFMAQADCLPAPGTVNVSGTNYLALCFTRNPAATDITYTVEGASVLTGSSWLPVATWSAGQWSPPGNVCESGTGSALDVQVLDTQPIGTQSRFLRLQVTH
jgi:hypothetical protein